MSAQTRHPNCEAGQSAERWLSEMAWAVPLYPRSQVDRAGKLLIKPAATDDELASAYTVVNNWRASHSYPLNNFQVNLRAKVRNIQADVLVAQRIKRLESIKAKLERDQTATLQLSQMQDIGGCRAVLQSLANVDKLLNSYRRSTFAHLMRGHKDYVATPKEDGYRGHHLIYQYISLPNQNPAYNRLRIEVQIRTAEQHAWATAVEAVGAFTKQALKSNQGKEEWLRFFALMGSAIAAKESSPGVPGTPATYAELVDEIRDLASILYVRETLEAYRTTLHYVGQLKAKNAKYFLLILQPMTQTVSVRGFRADQSQQANLMYIEEEKKLNQGAGEQAVLVSVDSLVALRRAYPNYFLDTKRFNELLHAVIHQNGDSTRPRAIAR